MAGELGGMMRVMPFIGTCFVFGAMASVGLPGFANFMSEMMVIFGAWESGMWFFIPAILSVWGLVITGVYLLRAVKNVWYGDMPERWSTLQDARTPIQMAPFLVLIGVLLFFGFYPQPMIDVIHQGAEPVLERVQAAGETAQASAGAPTPDGAARAAADGPRGGEVVRCSPRSPSTWT